MQGEPGDYCISKSCCRYNTCFGQKWVIIHVFCFQIKSKVETRRRLFRAHLIIRTKPLTFVLPTPPCSCCPFLWTLQSWLILSLFFFWNTACSCHPKGSFRSACHTMTGQCDCRTNVINRQCSSCRVNYYNLNSGSGCLACNCTPEYSTSLQCHADTGVCSCKRGVGGDKCTACNDQFYNLTSSGMIYFSS